MPKSTSHSDQTPACPPLYLELLRDLGFCENAVDCPWPREREERGCLRGR